MELEKKNLKSEVARFIQANNKVVWSTIIILHCWKCLWNKFYRKKMHEIRFAEKHFLWYEIYFRKIPVRFALFRMNPDIFYPYGTDLEFTMTLEDGANFMFIDSGWIAFNKLKCIQTCFFKCIVYAIFCPFQKLFLPVSDLWLAYLIKTTDLMRYQISY